MTGPVTMVCAQFPPVYGGAGAQAQLLASKLSSAGTAVQVVTLDQYGVGSERQDDGVRVRRVLRRVVAAGPATRAISSLALGLFAAASVLTSRSSVVHVHGAYWWSIPPAVAGRLIGSRVVVKITRDGEDDPVTVRRKKLGRLPVGRLYGLALRLATSIVVLNDRSRASAVEVGLGDKTTQIPNGVDRARLERRPDRRAEARAHFGLAETTRVVVFVGYLVEHKGVLDLVDAWRDVRPQDAELWLVGPESGFYRELSESCVARVVAAERAGIGIRRLGQRPAPEVARIYWAADVFVLPSYAEGMPNSLAEALVAGCTAVVSDIPGIREVVGAEDAYVVPAGDVDALGAALVAALAQPRPAPAELVGRLDVAGVVTRYRDLYGMGPSR